VSTIQSSFVWYELMSTDVAAAKAFYGKVVGWTMQDAPMPGMTYTLLHAGSAQIGGMMPLPKEAHDAGMKPCWVGYVSVEDVDRAADKLTGLGGKVFRPATDIPGVGRFAVVADAQGATFNLFTPSTSGQPDATAAPGHSGWRELHTTDWPKAFDFYKAMFGWGKGNAVEMGPMGTYQLFQIKGQDAGGMFNSPAAKSMSFWLYYFIVDDIDAAGARVGGSGGTVMQGPVQVPGGSWIVQARDPQGAQFALVGPKK
jgi:uncharacterized protein